MSEPVSILIFFDDAGEGGQAIDGLLHALGSALRATGAEATYKLTGARANQIRQSGRPELVALIQSQDVGYHSSGAADRPTAGEYIGHLDWADGVAAFAQAEQSAYEQVAFLAGRIPSCYGNEGWVPQAYGVLNRWGTRVCLSERGFLAHHDKPFFYGGRLNISMMGPRWIDVGAALLSSSESDRLVERIAGAVAGHAGRAGVVVVQIRPESLALAPELAIRNFQRCLERLFSIENAVVQSARQIADRFADISYEHRVSLDLMRGIAECARWGDLRPFYFDAGYISAAEQLYLLVSAWDESHRKGKLVRNSTTRTPLGPSELVYTDPRLKGIKKDEIQGVLTYVLQYVANNEQLPPAAPLQVGPLAIHDLLPTIAGGFQEQLPMVDLPLRRGVVAGTDRIREEFAFACWDGPAHPEKGFRSQRQIDLARLQAWTYKPVLEIG